jgi:hypothetical protein
MSCLFMKNARVAGLLAYVTGMLNQHLFLQMSTSLCPNTRILPYSGHRPIVVIQPAT